MKNYLQNRIVRRLLIAFGIFILLFILFNSVIMPWYVSSPEIKVPKVLGLKEADAFELLKNSNLDPVISDTTFDEQYPRGTIIYQTPTAGHTVKDGRRVYLYLSGGEPIVNAPTLKGKSLIDARFALERLGLYLGRTDSVSSESPKDVIVDQQYAAGTPLRKGDSVNVSISIGQAIGSVTVPNLIGKSLSEAEKILADSSLKAGKINYQKSFSLLPNTVLDQYPSKGNKINPGEAVDLFVTQTDESTKDKNIPGY